MEKEHIKSAFSKVKEDINHLYDELLSLKSELSDIKESIKSLSNLVSSINNPSVLDTKKHGYVENPTISTPFPTDYANSTHNTTVPQEIEGLKSQNFVISTGNEGVSTDRQTDQQTDISTDKYMENSQKSIESDIQKASAILDSLDRLKKEIRIKFKRVTPQEMAVFSTIYQLDEQDPETSTYKKIASILHLSESSIRDYVQRMINKGIPIKKQKINNRKLILSISSNLKKIATLATIIQLREL